MNSILASNAQNSVGFWGSAPDPAGGAYDAPPYPLIVRGFLPSAIATSRFQRSPTIRKANINERPGYFLKPLSALSKAIDYRQITVVASFAPFTFVFFYQKVDDIE